MFSLVATTNNMTAYTQTAIFRKFHEPIIRKGKVVRVRRAKVLDAIPNEQMPVGKTGVFVPVSPGQRINPRKYFQRRYRKDLKNNK